MAKLIVINPKEREMRYLNDKNHWVTADKTIFPEEIINHFSELNKYVNEKSRTKEDAEIESLKEDKEALITSQKILVEQKESIEKEKENLKVKNTNLQSTNESLKTENTNLEEKNTGLRSANANLEKKNQESKQTILSLQKELEEMKKQVAILVTGKGKELSDKIIAIHAPWAPNIMVEANDVMNYKGHLVIAKKSHLTSEENSPEADKATDFWIGYYPTKQPNPKSGYKYSAGTEKEYMGVMYYACVDTNDGPEVGYPTWDLLENKKKSL